MGKRFCIFAAQYFPHLGGVENYTHHMAKYLTAKGNSVVLVTSNVGGLKSFEVMEGIEIYRLPCWALLDGRYPFLKVNREFRDINRKLSEELFDLVIVNTRFYPHSVYGALFARKQKARCIFIEHGTGHMTVHNPVGDLIERIAEHILTACDKRFCKEYYGVSQACLKWLEHFGIQGSGTLYNAVDLGQIEMQLANPVCSFRKQYHISKDAMVVAFTGRLLKEKGVLTLANAVQNLNQGDKKVYLMIAGDGDEAAALDSFRSEYVLPLGRLTSEEVVALLGETDVFCLPSDSEGFSTSILEAAACRNFIITTSRGGASELLLDDSYGMVIENNDLETVQKSIEYAIENPQMRTRAESLTYMHLKKNFTWDIVSDKVLNLLK